QAFPHQVRPKFFLVTIITPYSNSLIFSLNDYIIKRQCEKVGEGKKRFDIFLKIVYYFNTECNRLHYLHY
ncbi:hypothetical protein KJ830_00955, partial [bacterium]|nr:hypothetical protein [bacterium]